MYKYHDSRLVILYKVTYNFAAIPASDYLIRKTRPSSRNPPIAYQQITTLKDFNLHVSPMDNNTLECTTTPHSHPAYLGPIQYGCLPGRPLQSLDANICFYLLTILTHSIALYKLISQTSSLLLFQLTTSSSWYILGLERYSCHMISIATHTLRYDTYHDISTPI